MLTIAVIPLTGWRKAPTKLPFGRWKLRFGRWKSFWPTSFGRWNIYLLKIYVIKICLLGGSVEREGLTNHDCNQLLFKAFPKTNFQIFLQLWWILKKCNHRLLSLLANNTTYKVIETACLVKYVWSCLQKMQNREVEE